MVTSLLAECESEFGTRDLYEVLDLTNVDISDETTTNRVKSKKGRRLAAERENSRKSITQNQIRKAYYKKSLKWHPDRLLGASGSMDKKKTAEATKRFQTLGRVYAILSDDNKRALYDESGVIDEENVLDSDEDTDWLARWRLLFKKVTMEDIEQFCQQYKDSAEERDDLKRAYELHGGDMGRILDTVLASSMDDESRFELIIREMIDKGQVEDYPKFSKESRARKMARRRRQAKEAEEAKEELENMKRREGDSDLGTMIARRQENRQKQQTSFLEELERKYSKKKAK